MHILSKPEQPDYIFIPELKQKIKKAILFNSKQEVKFKQLPEGTFIYMNGIVLDDIDTVIELQLTEQKNK